MAELWAIADTHFQQQNSLSWCDSDGELIRGKHWQTADEMDEALIANWNSCIMPSDKVYHCGDVAFGDREKFKTLWKRLNGKKRLVLGNHDDAKFFAKNDLVSEIVLVKRLPELGLILSHMPLLIDYAYKLHNVHGHLHQMRSPSPQHTCISVEQTGYGPINLRQLSAQLRASGTIAL